MAIVYYKKCLEIYPEYAQGYNNVAYRTEMLGNKE
jgi:tetratricopeptide (TPR) repeat protein